MLHVDLCLIKVSWSLSRSMAVAKQGFGKVLGLLKIFLVLLLHGHLKDYLANLRRPLQEFVLP